MRLSEINYEFKTKDGDQIKFLITPDSEGDKNRGFQVDRIDAFVDSHHAGYIKLSYIPEERFREWYPSVFHWMKHINGQSVLPYGIEKTPLDELSREDLKSAVEYINTSIRPKFGKNKRDRAEYQFIESLFHTSGWSRSIKPDVLASDLHKALKIYEKHILAGEGGARFKKFYDYHVDKPFVDYINVFTGSDFNKNKLDDGNRDWRRQRIATALYIKAAKYLKDKGLKLHASGLQSDEAKAAWAHLEKMGIVEPGDRRTINASKEY